MDAGRPNNAQVKCAAMLSYKRVASSLPVLCDSVIVVCVDDKLVGSLGQFCSQRDAE